VERLAAECLGIFGDEHGFRPVLNGAKAEAILHSWRERRVQELEAFKKYVHDRLDAMGVPHSDPESEHDKAGCRIGGRLDIVENALANSEWREQIRKEQES
jgi:hypothetical protein